MGERARAALSRARAVLGRSRASEAVEKTVWGSPAGKKRLAPKLVKLLPAHQTYVEPFAGSAAVLFEKEPAQTEVINDADLDIAKAYRITQRLTPAKLARLKGMNWTGDEAAFKRLIDAKPSGDLAWLHRFLYLTHFSYGKMRGKSFSPSVQGIKARTVERLEQSVERLKGVKVYDGDYEAVVKKYDGPNTVLFLDPPYPGYDVNVGESKFDEERFFALLKSLKGKWLMTYGVRGKLPKLVREAGFTVKQIRTPRTIGSMRGVGGPKVLTQLLVANYDFVKKAEGADEWLEDWAPNLTDPIEKTSALIKGLDPGDERYVLGVVLVPEEIDAQGDIYSADEVRQASHRFMEEFGGLGVMHKVRANQHIKVLESFIAPSDFSLNETSIKKGTWLMAVRVLSDELWGLIKGDQLTGFSIGGSARRVAEPPTVEEPA